MRIAFGPQSPGFGSWEWIGQNLADELSGQHETVVFRDHVPDCDAVVFVKFKPDAATLAGISRRASVIYCPVDIYGSAAEIDADWRSLRLCDLIVVHCRRLVKYFHAYSRVIYIDHHLKFITPSLPERQPTDGPILWTGNRANLPPLVEWVNRHGLPEELWVLTDSDWEVIEPGRLGFSLSTQLRVRAERWTPERHVGWASQARAAIDIKGESFRARHKPPAKALDFIASGLPLAMNPGSSPVEHLAETGLNITNPQASDIWFSEDYWKATVDLGRQ